MAVQPRVAALWRELGEAFSDPVLKDDVVFVQHLRASWPTLVHDGNDEVKKLFGRGGYAEAGKKAFFEWHGAEDEETRCSNIESVLQFVLEYVAQARDALQPPVVRSSIAKVAKRDHISASGSSSSASGPAGPSIARGTALTALPDDCFDRKVFDERLQADADYASAWHVGERPWRERSRAPVESKLMAVNVYRSLTKSLGELVRGDVPEQAQPYTAALRFNKEALRQAGGDKNAVRFLAAELCCVGEHTLRDWLKEYGEGGCKPPASSGPRRLNEKGYSVLYGDLDTWARAWLEEEAAKGNEHTWAEISAEALDSSEEFKEEMVHTLLKVDALVPDAHTDVDGDSVGRLLSHLGWEDGDNVKAPTEQRLHYLLCRRLKYLLGKMGYTYRSLVREALVSLQTHIAWAVSSSAWYVDYLNTVRLDSYHLWMDESFIYLSESREGGIMPGGSAASSCEKGDFRRIGLVDAVVLWWEKVDTTGLGQGQLFKLAEFAVSPQVWHLREVAEGEYARLRAGKLNLTSLVWFCSAANEKVEKIVAAAEALTGNMCADVFLKKWHEPVCKSLECVRYCTSKEELLGELRTLQPVFPVESRLTAEDLDADAALLSGLLGRKAVFHMDGARYHTKLTDGYLPREGKRSIYGPRGRGRVEEGVGMQKEACISYLFPPLPSPTPADEQWQEHLETLSVFELRRMVDEEAPEDRLEVTRICKTYGIVFICSKGNPIRHRRQRLSSQRWELSGRAKS